MKPITTLLFAILAASCAPRGTVKLTAAQLAQDAGTTLMPLDTLAAYRKMPGAPKTVYVKPFWRKTNHGKDSVYVAGYYRSSRQ